MVFKLLNGNLGAFLFLGAICPLPLLCEGFIVGCIRLVLNCDSAVCITQYQPNTDRATTNYQCKTVKSANCGYYRSTKEVLAELQISRTRLRDYCKFLDRVTPDEFDHQKYQSLYSPESFDALKKLSELFKQGYHQTQIEEKLRREGI